MKKRENERALGAYDKQFTRRCCNLSNPNDLKCTGNKKMKNEDDKKEGNEYIKKKFQWHVLLLQ